VIPDPASAPPRPDLTFLRRRARPRAAPSPVADFITGRGPHPTHPHPPATAPTGAPPSSSLDLSAPAAPATRPAPTPPSRPAPAPAAPATRRDTTPPARPAPVSSSLDLSDPPAAGGLDLSDGPAAPVAGRAEPSAAPVPITRGRRIRAGQQQLLSVTTPTVTLTRVQSGVGHLDIEAVTSAEVGDLRLGAAYQLADGTSSTVQYADGNRFAPSSRRPIIVAGRDEYEYLRLDLRQVRRLERLAVYAFSESRRPLTWGGTLVVTTFGGARIELPLETLFAGPVAVVLSIYNLDGELVIRAEMETITGDLREAARAYGYDRITWRDAGHPIDG
jgi:uncharacterized protein involved in tellurium resistance